MNTSFSYLTVGLIYGKERPVSVCTYWSTSVASVAPSWGCSYCAALPSSVGTVLLRLGQPVSTQSCLCKAGAPSLEHLHRAYPAASSQPATVPKGRFQWCWQQNSHWPQTNRNTASLYDTSLIVKPLLVRCWVLLLQRWMTYLSFAVLHTALLYGASEWCSP